MKRISENPYPSTRECADENGAIQRYANENHMAFEQGKQAQLEACEKEAQEKVGEIFEEGAERCPHDASYVKMGCFMCRQALKEKLEVNRC